MSNLGSYWIVACSAAEQGREAIYSVLKSRVVATHLCSDTAVFEIPLNIKYGSFDDLVRLVEDLAKYDSQIEGIIRRMERQAVEIDPHAEFKIIWQRNSMTVDQYIRRFTWDDAKYPRTRSMRDNVDLLVQSVQKLDDELQGKTAAFNEVKQSHSAASKSDAGSFAQRDLTDILTPEVVKQGDFVETEHLTTLVVCVPKSLANDWIKTYEALENYVVPRSATQFNVSDRESNQLWRVVIFKSSVDSFKVAAKGKKFLVRDFHFSADVYKSKVEERTRLEAEKSRQGTFLSRVCFAAFSDAFVAWVHLKAMRVFVEAVLRFGVPPNFAAFFLKPVGSNKEKKLRKELNDVFTTKGMFGKSYIEGSRTAEDAGIDNTGVDDEYYPYVSLELVPFRSAMD